LHDISQVYHWIFQHEALGHVIVWEPWQVCSWISQFLICDYKYSVAKICASSEKNYMYKGN